MKNTFTRFMIIIIIITIIMPLAIDKWIFGNNIYSNITNGEWAGFLGSFIGAMVGASCTCWAVLKQIDYNENIRKADEIAKIRPYLIAIPFSESDDIIQIQNIGLHSACDIYIQELNQDAQDAEVDWTTITESTVCVMVGETKKVSVDFDLKSTMYYKFRFIDLKSNIYEQEFRRSKDRTFMSIEPVLIKKMFE